MRWMVFLMVCWSGPAWALCPDPALDAPSYAATGADLIVPHQWPVTVEGAHAAPCAAWRLQGMSHDMVDGFFPLAPTARFELEGMAPHILMVMADAACSPVLAVRSADGQWHFGQTANGRDAVTIWAAPDGPLQVWVGSTRQESCDGVLTLETFDR